MSAVRWAVGHHLHDGEGKAETSSNIIAGQSEAKIRVAPYSRFEGTEVPLKFLVITKHLQTSGIVDLLSRQNGCWSLAKIEWSQYQG